MKKNSSLRLVEYLLLFAGLALLDYYVWQQASTAISQAYASWTLDCQIRGQQPSFGEFVLEEFRLHHPPPAQAIVRPADENPSMAQQGPAPVPAVRLAENELIGRLEIPRVGIRAMVREGTDSSVLERSVGHVPATALPWQQGNVAIAAHRDTFFRGLSQIHKDDV